MAFNPPGDSWYLRRKGVYPLDSNKLPMNQIPIYNIGTSLAPLFQKDISGYLAFGKYPFQTSCRSGLECVVEAIDLGGRKSQEYHSRKELAKVIGLMKMDDTNELGCQIQYKCTDCSNWQFSMEENREFLVVTADKQTHK